MGSAATDNLVGIMEDGSPVHRGAGMTPETVQRIIEKYNRLDADEQVTVDQMVDEMVALAEREGARAEQVIAEGRATLEAHR